MRLQSGGAEIFQGRISWIGDPALVFVGPVARNVDGGVNGSGNGRKAIANRDLVAGGLCKAFEIVVTNGKRRRSRRFQGEFRWWHVTRSEAHSGVRGVEASSR